MAIFVPLIIDDRNDDGELGTVLTKKPEEPIVILSKIVEAQTVVTTTPK